VIVVVSSILAFQVKTIFLDGLACRLPAFLRKEETSQNSYTKILDFIKFTV